MTRLWFTDADRGSDRVFSGTDRGSVRLRNDADPDKISGRLLNDADTDRGSVRLRCNML